MEIATERDEQLQLALECLEESRSKFFDGQVKEAEQLADRARAIFLKQKDFENYASACNSLGIFYSAMGNDNASLDYYIEGLRIADKYGFKVLEAIFLINLGSSYQDMKANQQALDFFRRASDIMNEHGTEDDRYPTFKLILGMNLSELYLEQGDFETALRYLEMAKSAINEPRNESYAFAFKVCDAYVTWFAGDHETVKNYVDDLHKSALESYYGSDYLEYMTDLCNLYCDMKEYDKWLEILERMESGVTENDSPYTMLRIYELFLKYCKVVGDQEKYTDYCVKFAEKSQEKKDLDNSERAEALDVKINYITTAKLRKKAENMMMKDPLTGIGSRHKMLKDSVGIIEHSVKNTTGIVIGLIDIDFFKECNDTYGHIAGDECLKKVAAVLQESVGSDGTVYRFGGDEFLIFITNYKIEQTKALGQKIQDGIAALKIPNEKSSLSPYITVSQGFTAAIAEEGDSIETLVNYADKVLYQVKRSGRNSFRFMKLSEIAKLD